MKSMQNLSKTYNDTMIRIGCRFSFANVFRPRTNPDGSQGKYGVCVVWPKSDTLTTKLVNDAIEAAKAAAKDKGIKLPAHPKVPIRDGDEDRPDDPVFGGCWFINANCGQKPGVRVLDNGSVIEALDEEDFYSGCYGAATVNLYPFDSSGNKGVGAGLNNVIKTADGERLSGGTNADADFADLADELAALE